MIDQIAAEVAKNESLGDYELHSLMTPSTGYDTVATKTLLTLVARQQRERVFVKISSSERLSHFLQEEAENLSTCRALGIQNIPQLLACGSIGGRYFMALKFVPWPRMHSRPSYLDAAMVKTKNWLAVLYDKTREQPVEAADLVRKAERYANPALEFFDLSDCLSMMERLAPRTAIPTFRVHGDFWHGNILVHGEEICVTDFAFSAPGEPPIDCIDLVCDYDPNILLDSRRLRKYSESLPFGNEDLPFFIAYSLIRKIGLKAKRRIELFEELVLRNLESSMDEISEVGVAKRVVRHYGSRLS